LLFRVAGIDVFLHWSWVLVAVFRIQDRALEYTSVLWNAAEYLTAFAIVLLHEFGHALACRQVGGVANRIVLWPLGGVAFVSPPPRPGAFLWSLAAGPLVNVALVPVTLGLFLLSRSMDWQQLAPDVHHYLVALLVINTGLLVFNLLPVYPLDGGQILQALLWFVIGWGPSLMVVSVLGLVAGSGLTLLALVAELWWLALLFGFSVLISLAGLARARQLLRMMHAPRYEELACPSCRVAPPVGEFWVCTRCRKGFDAFAQPGACARCGKAITHVICPECSLPSRYEEWFPAVVAVADAGG
jgi:Zn-dependent protease